jgi:hypothetical protein
MAGPLMEQECQDFQVMVQLPQEYRYESYIRTDSPEWLCGTGY